jgi:hypothetical protein
LKKDSFAVAVTSLMYLVERLEAISNQVGLKFTVADPAYTDILISSAMFVVRLLLTADGGVRDVQITHLSETRTSSVSIMTLFCRGNDIIIPCAKRG